MRVLFIIPYEDFGGPHSQVLRLKSALGSRQVQTSVLLPAGAGSAATRLEEVGVPVLKVAMHRLRKTLDLRVQAAFFGCFARDVRTIGRVIREQRADVVQIHGLLHPHGALAGRITRTPVAWQFTDLAPKPLRHMLMPMVRRYADVVMTNGREIARLYPGAGGLGERLVVFPPSVDAGRFRADSRQRQAAREELGLAGDDLVIGTVANVNRFKDLVTFVRAGAVLRRTFSRARFVILGSTLAHLAKYAESVWAEARALGFQLGIDLIQRDAGARVADLAQSFDVFWLTSVSEGAPTAIVEAMALGLPVVATAVGAVSEIVEHGVTGFITPPRDPEAIARATVEILRSPELRAAMSINARRTAVERFRPESSADAHLRAYQTAIAHRLGRGGNSLKPKAASGQ